MSLSVNSLTKSFGNQVVFDNFSYFFNDTGLYLIKGKNGIGKTTLIRIIAGLDRDYSGTVENGGAANVSFMFQEYRLFPTISALENTLISKSKGLKNEKKAQQMLLDLGISEEDSRKKPAELSGGMKQRVAFVRAVMKDCPILILDEPTKELDDMSVTAMLDIIKSEAKRRLVIMVTHDTALISNDATIITL